MKSSRPLLLDLFCKAGGAAMGYHQAGFDVIGVDIEPQPNYPFTFIQEDVQRLRLNDYFLDLSDFSAIHASPPCQAYSVASRPGTKWSYSDLVSWTRVKLSHTNLPYVIENVPGAPLIDPIQICGSSFGLRLRRHRLFECNWDAIGTDCDHGWQDDEKIFSPSNYHQGKKGSKSGVIGVYGHGQGLGPGEVWLWRMAMGILWMTGSELTQAIPPSYTRYLGRQLIKQIDSKFKNSIYDQEEPTDDKIEWEDDDSIIEDEDEPTEDDDDDEILIDDMEGIL